MNYAIITFRSITPAQRGERVLRSRGIRSTLRRTPRWMEEKGCGYSLQLELVSTVRSVQILKDEDIPFRKVYRIGEGDKAEELDL